MKLLGVCFSFTVSVVALYFSIDVIHEFRGFHVSSFSDGFNNLGDLPFFSRFLFEQTHLFLLLLGCCSLIIAVLAMSTWLSPFWSKVVSLLAYTSVIWCVGIVLMAIYLPVFLPA